MAKITHRQVAIGAKLGITLTTKRPPKVFTERELELIRDCAAQMPKIVMRTLERITGHSSYYLLDILEDQDFLDSIAVRRAQLLQWLQDTRTY